MTVEHSESNITWPEQETHNKLSMIWRGLNELNLHVPGGIFMHNVRISTNTIQPRSCGLILIYLRTFLILQLSEDRIRTNDSEFSVIHFPATELYSQRINTNLLLCIIYLLASSTACCGLT